MKDLNCSTADCQMCGTVCPRCGGDWNQYNGRHLPPALSRWDNKSAICSPCGMEEAIFSLSSPGYRDQNG